MIGPVQAHALELIVFQENIEKAKQKADDEERAVALALISSGDYLPQKVLPEVFGIGPTKEVDAGTPEADAAYARGDVVEDFSEVKWEAPSDIGEAEVLADLEAFSRAMTEHQSVSLVEGAGEWL